MVGSHRDFVEQVLVQAWRRPYDISVVGPAGQLTYGELDGLSAGIAEELTDAGVRPGAIVGVCLGQDHLLPAVLLGVVRAGAAYLPLDLEHPLGQLEFQVADSGTRVLLAAKAGLEIGTRLAGRFDGDVLVIDVGKVVPITDARLPPASVEVGELAYLFRSPRLIGVPTGVVTRESLGGQLDGGPVAT